MEVRENRTVSKYYCPIFY